MDLDISEKALNEELKRQADVARDIAMFLRSDNPITQELASIMELEHGEKNFLDKLAEKADNEASKLEEHLNG